MSKKLADCVKVDSTIHKIISQLAVRFNRSEEDILSIVNSPFNGIKNIMRGEYVDFSEIDEKIEKEEGIVINTLSTRGLFYEREKIMKKIREDNPRLTYHNFDKISIIGFISLVLKREKYGQFKKDRNKKGNFTTDREKQEKGIVQT